MATNIANRVVSLSLREFNEVSGLGLVYWEDEDGYFLDVLAEFQRDCANLVAEGRWRDPGSRNQYIHTVALTCLSSEDPSVDIDLFAHCVSAHEVEIAAFPQVIVDNLITDLPTTGAGHARRALYLAYFHAVERVLDWVTGQEAGADA